MRNATIALCLIVAACSGVETGTDRIDGNGTITTTPFDVSGFSVIELAGEGDLLVDEAEAFGLTVEIDENLLEHLEVEADDGVLRIGTASGIDIEPTATPVYRVTLPTLEGVTLSGAGSVITSGSSSASVAIELSGAGDIDATADAAAQIDIRLSGVGDITVAGATGTLDATVSGVGRLDASDLAAQEATIVSSGTADAVVWASEIIDITLTGIGDVAVYGEPATTIDDSGPGTVELLGDR